MMNRERMEKYNSRTIANSPVNNLGISALDPLRGFHAAIKAQSTLRE
jgi:hypothetical protein